MITTDVVSNGTRIRQYWLFRTAKLFHSKAQGRRCGAPWEVNRSNSNPEGVAQWSAESRSICGTPLGCR
jgi:hypothetical protein